MVLRVLGEMKVLGRRNWEKCTGSVGLYSNRGPFLVLYIQYFNSNTGFEGPTCSEYGCAIANETFPCTNKIDCIDVPQKAGETKCKCNFIVVVDCF